MAKRNPVSSVQNIWFDSEQVDAEDLIVEQNYNNAIDSSIINNHIGSGIVPFDMENYVLFDSSSISGNLDGEYLVSSKQPSDNNYGNQLEIALSESSAGGRRAVKIAIIGLDFEQNLQYEVFYFKTNESQVTKKHYTSVLQILINDFKGDKAQSFNLGGRIIIREASPLSLSRNTLSVAQNFEPSLFWRDFFVPPSNISLENILNIGLSNYNISDLGIKKSGEIKTIPVNNVTLQIGQKFKSKTNNIQKITLLLSVSNTASNPDDYLWNGEVVVSVYSLQNSLQCPTDIPPETLIDYPPSPIPLAQISFDYESLKKRGVVLNSIPQPVEFIFSNTAIGGSTSIIPDNFYAFTLKRSGSADKGDIYISYGSNYLEDSRLTVFDGNSWQDFSSNSEDLWFEIYSDAAKVTDGQAYVSGNGVVVEKVTTDSITSSVVDYCLDNIYFSGSDTFTATVFADTEKTTPVQDLRTGNLVYSRQKNIPEVKLLSTIDLQAINGTSDPLLVGSIRDKNVKFFDPSSTDTKFSINIRAASFFKNEIFIKIIDDESAFDYDADIKRLRARLLTGDFTNIKLNPTADPNFYYRVASAELISSKYGDLDSDGVVTSKDLDLLKSYVGFDLNNSLKLNSEINPVPNPVTPTTVTFANGYRAYSNSFKDQLNAPYYVVDSSTNQALTGLKIGQVIKDPNNVRRASLVVVTVGPISSVPDLMNNYLVINGSVQENNGGFKIIEVPLTDDTTFPGEVHSTVVIEKIVLNKDSILQIFKSDVKQDYIIKDGYDQDTGIVEDYVNKKSFIPGNDPGVVGKSFDVLRLVLEKSSINTITDRTDDYYQDVLTRSSTVHPIPDIIEENPSIFVNKDVATNKIAIAFEKQLSWEDYLVVSDTKSRLVSAIFNQNEDVQVHSGEISGIKVQTYNSKPLFDPGRVDFFVPDNLLIGEGGEILRSDGVFYKVDFEVGTVVLEIPKGMLGSESDVNLFDDFIQDYENSGVTRIGFPAMKFADGSFVQSDALTKDQLRFSVSVQSFSPDVGTGGGPAIVDGKMGVSVDYQTGVVKLNFTNLYIDSAIETLSTRVQVNVFLKKGGFNNKPLKVDHETMGNIVKVISSISNPFGLSNIKIEITDIDDLSKTTVGGTGEDDKLVVTNQDGLINPSLNYKNPIYIYGVAVNNSISTPHSDVSIGALTFRFDQIIMDNLEAIYFENIVKGDDTCQPEISLYHVNDDNSYSLVTSIATPSPLPPRSTLIRSSDIQSLLLTTSVDHVYEIVVSCASGSVIYQMSRLALIYNVPN
jgi:hypothetical protein